MCIAEYRQYVCFFPNLCFMHGTRNINKCKQEYTVLSKILDTVVFVIILTFIVVVNRES